MNRTLVLAALSLIILLLGAVSHAAADTAIVWGSGATAQTASDTVTVKAVINSKLTMTVVTPAATQTVDFGTVDPGTATASQNVTMTVQSNRTYNVTIAKAGDVVMGLSTTLGNSVNNTRTAGQVYNDSYKVTAPWTTAPGSYAATVQYTLVQN